MTLVDLVPAPQINPDIDKSVQTIPSSAGPDPQWTKLRFQGETKWLPPAGRTFGKTWISADLPDDPERLAAIAEVAALATNSAGTNAQRIARLEANGQIVKRNLLWLLRHDAPTWQFRVTRWDGTAGGNWTLRNAAVLPPLGDWSAVYVFELYTDGKTDHSVEVRHDAPFAIDLDAREFDAKHEGM